MKGTNKYITTAIPYVNGKPHIGHVMDYLIADCLARYFRMGHDVRFSAGLDEHGCKVEQEAQKAGVTPLEFVNNLEPDFTSMLEVLNISYTDFIRTTDENHIARVQEIWKKLDKAGVIYKAKYEGWYCGGCECFITESEAKSSEYLCPNHQKSFEKIEEENYFLKISKFSDELRDFAKKNVIPEFRGREILELIKDGAQDVSISRSREKLNWGVPVPGDETQVMYVWVDALSNYITVLGYPENDISDWWPAEVQVVGKDILRFHAIIWPAMLLALGLELPKTLFAHGFINLQGGKMSKSLGNVVDPIEITASYGADAVRYYFLRHGPIFDDADFSLEKFVTAYNSELANDLGNLVSRLAKMIQKYEIKAGWTGGPTRISGEVEKYHNYLAKYEVNRAIDTIWEMIKSCNQFIDETKPWELAKNDQAKLAEVLNILWGDIMIIQALLQPFLPDTATKIKDIFAGDTAKEAEILFPRL